MTINDIAKVAGVSRATVSRYINNNGYLSAKARERIEQAIADNNFVLNQEARSLRSGKSNLIGIILPSLDIGYINRIEDIIQSRFEDEGYSILLARCITGPEQRARAFATMNGRNVDGLFVMAGTCPPDHREAIRIFKRPVVAICAVPTGSTTVIHSDYDAFQAMAEHAITRGHTKVALASRYMQEDIWQEKVSAVTDTLQKHNLAVVPEWFQSTTNCGLQRNLESQGYEMVSRLLQQSEIPNAILCDTDKCAAGALRCLREHHLETPKDVAIVSFGNTSVAEYCTPSLSSLDIDTTVVGNTAVALMLSLLRGETLEKTDYHITPFIVQRDST